MKEEKDLLLCKTKICKGYCGEEKPLEEFAKRERNTDGRNNVCKKCEVKKQTKRNRKRMETEVVVGYNEVNPFDWIWGKL